MNIGIDIDNVITDLDAGLLAEFLREDRHKRNAGVIDREKYIIEGMFDWSIAEIDDFLDNNMERIASELRVRKNCKIYMDRLLADGNQLILISHRVYPHYRHANETTRTWLARHKINYTKLILSKAPDKTEECLANHIDLMIDDRPDMCKLMRAKGINCILMQTRYNRREKCDLPCVTSWAKLYDKIKGEENNENLCNETRHDRLE